MSEDKNKNFKRDEDDIKPSPIKLIEQSLKDCLSQADELELHRASAKISEAIDALRVDK